MRAILFILILAVVALIAAIATGMIDIRQTRPAELPDVDANRNGVTATGGQTPAFDVETGTVKVGAGQANVTVPVPQLTVDPAGSNAGQAAATNSAP